MSESEKQSVQLLAISVDSREITSKFIQYLRERYLGDYDFPFLEDKGHKVIDRYGIYNPDGRGWPHPATYVIDMQGIVRWKFIEVDYRVRPTNERVLQELKKIK